MDTTSLLFIFLSLVVLIYIFYTIKTSKRVHLLSELAFGLVYAMVLLFFLYPPLLTIIEEALGITSALNFMVYLSIFVAYFLIFRLYNQKEVLREDITKLTREIALMRNDRKK